MEASRSLTSEVRSASYALEHHSYFQIVLFPSRPPVRDAQHSPRLITERGGILSFASAAPEPKCEFESRGSWVLVAGAIRF